MSHAQRRFLCTHRELRDNRVPIHTKIMILSESPHRPVHLRLLHATPPDWLPLLPPDWLTEDVRPPQQPTPTANDTQLPTQMRDALAVGAHVEYSYLPAAVVDRICQITQNPHTIAKLCTAAAERPR